MNEQEIEAAASAAAGRVDRCRRGENVYRVYVPEAYDESGRLRHGFATEELMLERSRRDHKVLADAYLAAGRAELFRIAPLKWRVNVSGDCFTAETPFGVYCVEEFQGSWTWRYCTQDDVDDGDGTCESPEDGKAKSWAHWQDRIKGALTIVEKSP